MSIPLFARSCYSLLEGVLSPKQLAETAAEAGYTALVQVDHNYLTGAVEFTLACREQGIQPILGLEIDLQLPPELAYPAANPPRLVLIARDQDGWSNLCKMSSILQVENRPVTLAELAGYTAGLFCLSGDELGLLPQLILHNRIEAARSVLSRLAELFPDVLFVQLYRAEPDPGPVDEILANLARQFGLPLIAAPVVNLLDAGQAEIHRALLAIRYLKNTATIGSADGYQPKALFARPDEIQRRFRDTPDALKNSLDLSAGYTFALPLGVPRMPILEFPDGKTTADVLREKAYRGAAELYREVDQRISARLDHELEVISHQGFEPIFLIMQEVLDFARSQGIQFSSRGSAASSLVAHCLGITSPDPIRLNLYFERFLNPARTTPPDIDTDIDSNRRDEVLQHIFEQYGRDRVAMVGTINRFRPRSAVGDVAKAYGLSPAESQRLAKELPHSFFAARSAQTDASFLDDQFKALSGKYSGPQYQKIFSIARAILGLPHHLSVHPGGVVIAPVEMTSLVPVMCTGSRDTLITQFDLDALEEVGLVKMDMLGIRGLSVMSSVAQQIYNWSQKEYANPTQVLEAIPQEDPDTSDLVFNGRTIGCFQIESPGMQSTLKLIHARTPDDLMAALALYRPGPMRGGLRDAFIRRHNHEETVVHLHPTLTGILEDTYGVILYQEQVLMIANQIAGLSLADSDLLRRAMSHFDPGKQMQSLKQRFIRGAAQVSDIDSDLANQIWEMMAAFAGYGFPKAHSASYAQISWRFAWCKSHFPAEFIAAVLANWGGYYSQRIYLTEARRLGFKARPPHINHSQPEFLRRIPGRFAGSFYGVGPGPRPDPPDHCPGYR